MRSRAELWPAVPVIFSAVDEETAARLNLPSDATGTIYQLPFRNMVAAAQALVPNLKRIALVRDSWAVRRHYQEQIPAFAAQFEFIDLIGLPMTEIRKRVAVLPDDTAIIYTGLMLEGAGPHEGLAAFARVANRPIVMDAETGIGYGGTGGFVATPVPIAQATARIALRILDGEAASKIPVVRGDFVRPVFDWRQLQRFGISESRLPTGSEIRFRPPGLWDQYHWQVMAALAVVLLQAAMITWLLFERRRRQIAQLESRRHLLEVIHLNRTATAGALSASVGHELNQPLGAILSNTEAAETLLTMNPPDMRQLRDILADIRRDDQRASDIIRHLRGLLKKTGETELQRFDLNDAIGDAIHILVPEAMKRGVVLSAAQGQGTCAVCADEVHLQQVLLNLAINGMDAMSDCAPDKRRLEFRTALRGISEVEVSVSDSGTGIPNDKLNDIFETFYTTKRQGTGLGLSIARTLVETYGGRIWAENRTDGGAAFRFTLPLAETRPA
jgi:signal transduction histidine kinase